MIGHVFRYTSVEEVVESLSSVRTHGNKIGFHQTRELKDSCLFMTMVKDVDRKILESVLFSKIFQSIVCYGIRCKVYRCIDPNNVKLCLKEGLQCFNFYD